MSDIYDDLDHFDDDAIADEAQQAEEVKGRTAWTNGLRRLADLIDAHPDLPIPFGTSPYDRVHWCVSWAGDAKAHLAALARAVPGSVEKEYEGQYFNLNFALDGLHLQAFTNREQVCERVVTGTRTVTKTVKDPEALALVPDVEVIETEDVVEWVCGPLLSERAS